MSYVTVGEWVQLWAERRQALWNGKTQAAKESFLRRVCVEEGEASKLQYIPIDEATEADVRSWWDALQKQFDTYHMNYTSYGFLRQALRAAVEEGLITESPAKLALERPAFAKKTPADPASMKAVVRASEEHDRLAMILMLFHGLSFQEVAPLRREDFTHSERGWQVSIHRVAQKSGSKVQIKEISRNYAARRVVPILPKFTTAVEHHLATWVQPGDKAWVFATDDGEMITVDALTARFRKARKIAGVPKLTTGAGRIWLIVEMAKAGVSIPAAARIVGSAESKFIAEVYASVLGVEDDIPQAWEEISRDI